jgi:hypothetical protein
MTIYFRGNDEKTYTRLLHMQQCVQEQPLHSEPCPLLIRHLNELEVFGAKMLSLARELRESVEGYHK